MRIMSCLPAFLAGWLACSALVAAPVAAQTVPGGAPGSSGPLVTPPRPNSPIPRAEGVVPPPNAIQVEQWMEALRAAWRAGRCDELREGIKEMRTWLWVLENQVEGLKAMLRSEPTQYGRDRLSRQIADIQDRIRTRREQLDWLERQPCPPPPEEEDSAGTIQAGRTQRELMLETSPVAARPVRSPVVVTVPSGPVGRGLITTRPGDLAIASGPRQTGATAAQREAQWQRYEELLRLWEEARRLDAEHAEAARRCDSMRMAAIRAQLNALYSSAQTTVQTMGHVQGQTGASGVPDSPGYLSPQQILDRMLELTDKADKRRPATCGGQAPPEEVGQQQPPTGGESAGEPPHPPPETGSVQPPRETETTLPARSPSPADGIGDRAHASYNRALDAAMSCDEEQWKRAIAELEEQLRIVDAELAILNDPVRRRERLMNTPARIQRLSQERAQIQRYLEAARAFKLRCVEEMPGQSDKRSPKSSR